MPHRGVRPASGPSTPARRRLVAARPGAMAAALLAGVLVAGEATAQSVPTSLRGLISTSSVSADDAARIERFVGFHADRLAAGGPDAAESAARLLEPISTVSASRSFRGAFASAAVPRMRGIAADPPSPFAAANAIIVLTKIGTPAALETLLGQADPDRQDQWSLRLTAARGVDQLLEDDYNDGIDERTRLRTSRELASLAEREEDPRVLRYVLLAMIECDAERLDDGTRTELHQRFASSLATVARRAASDASLASATGLAVAEARNAFLELASRRQLQVAFSRALAPALVELVAAYESHWPSDGGEMAARHAAEIDLIETALGFVVSAANPSARIPERTAAGAWEARDRGGFTSAVGAWRATLR